MAEDGSGLAHGPVDGDDVDADWAGLPLASPHDGLGDRVEFAALVGGDARFGRGVVAGEEAGFHFNDDDGEAVGVEGDEVGLAWGDADVAAQDSEALATKVAGGVAFAARAEGEGFGGEEASDGCEQAGCG